MLVANGLIANGYQTVRSSAGGSGDVFFEQRHQDGLTFAVCFAIYLAGAKVELKGAHHGAALLIPLARLGQAIAIAGQLLLPHCRIPVRQGAGQQLGNPSFIGPGTDPVFQIELAPGEVGAGVLFTLGGDIAVAQYLSGRDLVAGDQLLTEGADGGNLRRGVGVASAALRAPADSSCGG